MVVLILLNTYPLLVSQDLVFHSKESALASSTKVLESALTGLEELTEENVGKAMERLDQLNVSRVLVTDLDGRVLYDSRETENARGMYVFYTEIVQALRGNDAFFCRYDGQAFVSRAASPVVFRSRVVGAVYAYEYDTEQATLLENLQGNLMKISAVVAVLVVLLSMLLSHNMTQRIRTLLQAIQNVREGSYSTRAQVNGTDEIAQIATEFNRMSDRLQKTEDARRRFVSDASHELKTPLAGIRLLTDSILQAEHMEESMVREFVLDIGHEAQRLSRISEDLLRLSRLDSDQAERAYPVRMEPVLKRVVRMLQMVAQKQEISLTYEADERAMVLATEDDMHQVLYNLIENGIKYSAAGGVVHTQLCVEDNEVVARVSDNGIGIPEEDRQHIFERFYRVDKMRSREIGGTGLGLSIVRDTVENRGGQITVEPRSDGPGTVFTVRLPLMEGGEIA